jgi:hypothetical protein
MINRNSNRSKSLSEIRAYLKSRLGGDIVSVELEDNTIDEIILDALLEISQKKPKIIVKTISGGLPRNGRIQITEKVYYKNWKFGEAEPEYVPRSDVITFLNVEPANTTDKFASTKNPFHSGNNFIHQNADDYRNVETISSYMDRFINYEILDMSIGAINGIVGNTFDWMLDDSDPTKVFYTNLTGEVTSLTLEVAVEHTLGELVIPASNIDAVTKTQYKKIGGSVLTLTQDLARGMLMETIGEIRSKLEGGSNSTQLNGSDILSRGLSIQENVRETLSNSPDHWGAYSD